MGILLLWLVTTYAWIGVVRVAHWEGYWTGALGGEIEAPTWGETLAMILLWPTGFAVDAKLKDEAKEN